MGNYWTNAVRHPEDIGMGYLRRTINFDTPTPSYANGLGVPIGALEAGAVVRPSDVTIVGAFSAGATLVVGTADDDDGFIAAAGSAATAAGYKPNLVGALSGQPMARNTIVYAKMTGAPSAGSALVVIQFTNKREIEGLPFPNNP